MSYHYEERMNELSRVSHIPYLGVRIHALQNFIEIERQILRSLEVPQNRSHALDAAIDKLEHLIHPVQDVATGPTRLNF